MLQLKYVMVGAPSSGKTTVMSQLKRMVNVCSDIHVDFIDELASHIFFNNLPDELKQYDNVALRQIRLFRTQLFIEEIIMGIRKENAQNSILITDRGIADIAVYLTSDEIERYLSAEDQIKIFNNYDHVLYYPIASEEKTSQRLTSNPARQEVDFSEIVELDRRTYSVWSHYKCLDVIPQQDTVKKKAQITARLINNQVGSEVFITDHMFE